MLIRFTPQLSLAEISRITARCEAVGVQYKLIQEMGTSYLAIESPDQAKIDELYFQLKHLPVVEAIIKTGEPKDPLLEMEPIVFRCATKRIGKGASPVLIAGSPYLESRNQAVTLASELAAIGVHLYKAGPYRPSELLPPKELYSHTGGIVKEIISQSGIPSTGMIETPAPRNAISLLQASALHIPGKFLFDSNLRESVAKIGLPIFLERHPHASTQLWLDAARAIIALGNTNVALVEVGKATNGDLEIDLITCAKLTESCPLPLIIYPSLASRSPEQVKKIARAALALGASGVMIDVHLNPLEGLLTDGYCLSLEQFRDLYQSLRPLLI